MTAIVRPATSADLATIGRLGALLVEEHHGFDARRFLAATGRTAEGYASWIGSQLEVTDVVVLVAAEGAVVIGYAYAAVEGTDWMSLRGPAGIVHDIVVDRDRAVAESDASCWRRPWPTSGRAARRGSSSPPRSRTSRPSGSSLGSDSAAR